MVGNKGKIDTLGFIDPEHDDDTAITHIATRLTPDLNIGKIKSKQKIKLKACSNCWICEGWTEVKFEFTPGISSSEPYDPEQPIYLHASTDDYAEDLMLPDPDKSGTYSSLRMVPPGDLSFYFSYGTKALVADDQPKKAVSAVENITVPKTNVIENIIQKNALITKTYLTNMKCIPRPPPKHMLAKERLKTPWDFFKSVFRSYKPDDKKTLNGCFEFDWDNSKIPKVVKNGQDLKQVKDYLKENYAYFRETYKYYSAVAPAGLIFCIGSNTFSDIISSCGGIVDNDTLKLSDLDLEFVATNAGGVKSKFDPDRALCRYEFMEIFVRIAITKFFKNKIVETIPEAVQKIFEEHMKTFFSQFNCHKWRRENLWNEPCDVAFKRHLNTVERIYKANSGRYALPGAPKFMSLDEFYDLITSCGVVDDNFGQREISVMFNLSMMTQKNELQYDRHFNMILVEFIEAIGRIADKLILPPIIDEHEPEEEREPYEKLHMSVKRRLKKPYPGLKLEYKIETLIYLMARASLKKSDIENMEKVTENYYREKMTAPKAKKYGISEKNY